MNESYTKIDEKKLKKLKERKVYNPHELFSIEKKIYFCRILKIIK